MTKQECIVEMKALLAKLEAPILVKTVRPIVVRLSYLCDLLDQFEAKGE